MKDTTPYAYATSLSIRIASLLLALWVMPVTARGQIFVTNISAGTIGEYTTTGATVNANLVTGLHTPYTIAASGGNLFVANGSPVGAGTIGEYTTSGATVNAALISGFFSPHAIAASGSDLFVGDIGPLTIGKYTTSGATVNAALITGLNSRNVTVSGSNLFVSEDSFNRISEYTTAGSTVNATLITGLNGPQGIAVSGSNLFVVNAGNILVPGSGSIGEYNAVTGATINAALITGLNGPFGIAVYGSNLFVANNGTVTNGNYDPGSGSIGEYTTSGATVNAALIAGLNNPHDIAVVPEPSSLALAALGFVGLAAWGWRRRKRSHA